MAITSLTYRQTGPTEFTFSYTSGLSSPTFWIYINGEFITTTLETTYKATVPISGQLQFDVFDDASSVPPEHYPAQATIRWYGRDGAAMYRVDRYVDSTWVPQQTIPYSRTNLFHYTSGVLADVTTHQFRVIPIGPDGHEGTALNFSVEMVRYPDAPSQTMTFTGGELVIS